MTHIELSLANAKAYVVATGGQLTKNFHIREFKCKDGTVVPERYFPFVIMLAHNLQALRNHLTVKLKRDCPIHINSGYRTPKYNATLEGAAAGSMHLVAGAGDLSNMVFSPKQIADEIEFLISVGVMKEGGLGRYAGFTHYDIRKTKSRWGKN